MENNFSDLFSSKGRIRRNDFYIDYFVVLFIGNILLYGVSVVIYLLGSLISFGALWTINFKGLILSINAISLAVIIALQLAYLVLSIIILVCSAIKRLHDIDKSGIYAFLLIIPVINLLFVLYLLFKRGNPNENKYGINPKIVKEDASVKDKIVSNNYPNIKYEKIVEYSSTFDGDYKEFHISINDSQKDIIYYQIQTEKYCLENVNNKNHSYKDLEKCLSDLINTSKSGTLAFT